MCFANTAYLFNLKIAIYFVTVHIEMKMQAFKLLIEYPRVWAPT